MSLAFMILNLGEISFIDAFVHATINNTTSNNQKGEHAAFYETAPLRNPHFLLPYVRFVGRVNFLKSVCGPYSFGDRVQP